MSVETQLFADCPEVIPVAAEWWYDEWGHVTPEITLEQHIEQIRADVTADRIPVHVAAFVDGQPAGAAILKNHEMQYRYPDWKYWLGNVYVAGAWRGRGVAAALSRRIIEVAEAHGLPALYLQTKQLDGGLYARLGWQPIEVVDHRGRDVCVMIRTIESAGS